MAEIITEIIVVRKWKFCNELWDIIKDYMGIHGIKLHIPKLLSSIGLQKLANVMHTVFRIKVNIPSILKGSEVKRKLMLKALYQQYNSFDKDKKLIACNLAYDYLNDLKFTVPEDLKIGELIKIVGHGSLRWSPSIGMVHKISKGSFTVIYNDATTQVIRSKIYIRNK
jgi:hypothetical protein